MTFQLSFFISKSRASAAVQFTFLHFHMTQIQKTGQLVNLRSKFHQYICPVSQVPIQILVLEVIRIDQLHLKVF